MKRRICLNLVETMKKEDWKRGVSLNVFNLLRILGHQPEDPFLPCVWVISKMQYMSLHLAPCPPLSAVQIFAYKVEEKSRKDKRTSGKRHDEWRARMYVFGIFHKKPPIRYYLSPTICFPLNIHIPPTLLSMCIHIYIFISLYIKIYSSLQSLSLHA